MLLSIYEVRVSAAGELRNKVHCVVIEHTRSGYWRLVTASGASFSQ